MKANLDIIVDNVKRNSKVRFDNCNFCTFNNCDFSFQTVLESAPTPGQQPEDDFELWDQSQMLHADSHRPLWRKGTICKPSCIPITVILVLIVLVVLLPLLDHNNDKHTLHKPSNESSFVCSDACK